MTQSDASINGAFARPRFLFKKALDALLPPQCLNCRTIIEENGALCPECWEEINFAAPPHCHICGLTYEFDPGANLSCGSCVRDRPLYRQARTVMAYGKISRKLVISFKHGDGCEAAPAFARWMVRAGGSLIANADLVTPVPLHWTRLFTRRYNQSALIALEIGKQSNLEVSPDLLIRRKRTRSQGGLGPKERQKNLKNAFKVRPSQISKIKGMKILLVDDVFTTGATVTASTKALLDVGCESVDVLTLVKVMKPAY